MGGGAEEPATRGRGRASVAGDRFARQAPGAPQGADPFYAYAQVVTWV